MGEPVRRAEDEAEVVSLSTYIGETITEIDEVMAYLGRKRAGLAERKAAIDAAESLAVMDAAADYRQRVEENRPYEGAEDAGTLLSEAFSRFVR